MTASARDLDLRQHHGVETPEHVDVRFELAGVGSRVAAGLLDLLLLLLGLLLLWLGGTTIASDITPPHGTARGWVTAVLILLTFSLVWGYFTLFEALNGGRTPGKQLLGIRVVMDTGRSLTTQAAVVRNLVRFIDCYFPALPFAPALLAIALHPSNKRLGDMAAGTIVVRDRPTDWTLGLPGTPAPEAAAEAVETGPPDLSEEEFRLLDRFLGRLNELAPDVQARITADLVRRFEPRIPRRTPDLQSYLVTVFAEEQRKRRSRFASRAQAGTAGRITVPAERFVQKKRDGWEAFRTTALRMERSGAGAHLSGRSARHRVLGAGRHGRAQCLVSRSGETANAAAALYPAQLPSSRGAVVAVCVTRLPALLGPGGRGLRHDPRAAGARGGAPVARHGGPRGGRGGKSDGGTRLRRNE